MTLLSAHFELEEFTLSQVASRLGEPIVADATVRGELARLCQLVLEPLRAAIGRPLIITSGYRPEWINAAIGGAHNSAHTYGRAADVHAPGMTPLQLCQAVQRCLPLWPVDQLIYEFGAWCHVAIAAVGAEPRMQVLTARYTQTRTEYLPGLIA